MSGAADRAPLVVAPARQRAGIGTALSRAGLSAGVAAGVDAFVGLGDPQYYPRFGFAPASHFGLRSVYGGSNGSFMALELPRGALAGAHDLVCYSAEFDAR